MAPELPVEIIELCFSFLDTRDKPTCAAACLTSKFYSREATRVLYRDIGYREGDPQENDRLLRLRLLTRTLIERPDLRNHVRVVRHYFDPATPISSGAWDDWVSSFVLTLYDTLPIAKGNLFALLTSEWAGWFADGGHAEAYTFYIALCCPKVEVLAITGDASQMIDLGYLDYLLCEGPAHLHETNTPIPELEVKGGLESIMEIRLAHDIAAPHFTVESVSRVLNTYMLTVLEIECLGELTGGTDELTDVESGVMTIRLADCCAPAEDIAMLLKACPELGTLIIEWMYAAGEQDWQALAEGLKHCPLLEHLSIEEGNPWDVDDMDLDAANAEYDAFFGFGPKADMQQGIGSLRHLSKLTDLTIPKRALLVDSSAQSVKWLADDVEVATDDSHIRTPSLTELLPDSLETLTIGLGSRMVRREEADTLLNDPKAASLQNMTVMGCAMDHWFSTKNGEGGCSPSRGRWRRKIVGWEDASKE